MAKRKTRARQSQHGYIQLDESECNSGWLSQEEQTAITVTRTRSLLTKKHMIDWWQRERLRIDKWVVYHCIRYYLGWKYGASSLMPPLTELFAAEYQREREYRATAVLSFGILKRLQLAYEISDRQGM